jgi:hypothetical protein
LPNPESSPRYQKRIETVRYVLTANTSQTRGERKLIHICIWFGYGKSQYANHGRPRWMSGKSPAQMTAKMVMASAERLIAVRQRCRKRCRIAEMSVPACPIPIHQTKLVISQPQATGLFKPHTPMPVAMV